MNILIVSQYFWPEYFIINDLALKLQEQGHKVTVYTGKPNYPDGDIYPGYQYQGVDRDNYKGISIYRVPLRPRKNGGYKNLILNYLSFVFFGVKHSFSFIKQHKKFDMIFMFGMSPITAAIPAIFLKWQLKSHLTIWVQDLWPESVRAAGYSLNKIVYSGLRLLVKAIYFFADTLLVQSEAFIPIISMLTRKDKIFYYPNSVVDYYSQSEKSALPPELHHLLSSYFCIVFAGNIGTAQAIETILAAAEYLKDNDMIRIVLVGSGSQLNWAHDFLMEKKMTNVVLAGRYPIELMPAIFSLASALLVTLKKNEIFTHTIPSKIQAYLASAKPIIASLDGEGARIIKEAKAGMVSAAENAEELANNIKFIYDLPLFEREKMGNAGRAYFLKHYEMDTQCLRLIELFEKRLKETHV